ncbi:hypothetical protein NKG94_51665 [Micromonospora sp. M12]
MASAMRPPSKTVTRWLLKHRVQPAGPESGESRTTPHPWWKVMCLTGWTTSLPCPICLASRPSLRGALTAGDAADRGADAVRVLPMYRRVAGESPNGQGSVAMLERLLPFWKGKLFVLVLLGFVATSWIITITLSSADATVHLLENPVLPDSFPHGTTAAVVVTVVLLLVLGGCSCSASTRPSAWPSPGRGVPRVERCHCRGRSRGDRAGSGAAVRVDRRAHRRHRRRRDVIGPRCWPSRFVLGLSGFETGVSMMPLVRGDGLDAEQRLAARIRNTRKLLTTAALVMSGYLVATTLVTTVLIPAEEFQPGGAANGRALAYLAHERLGEAFGTVYDVSSVLILWFAGASAMAGLINIVPRYLPSYGMAPSGDAPYGPWSSSTP